ncbi:MAG: glycoside hydrolase family 3 protein [Clostridia bacterium]|nr:glycoside hydrolase family 3 protein [Clostridia bacterium]
MKKPLLSEMTLHEKIGQMLCPNQWDVFGRRGPGRAFTDEEMAQVHARYADGQFGTLRGEHTGVFYADPRYYVPVDREENAVEGNLFTLGRAKVPPVLYKKFMEGLGSYIRIPPLVAGDYTVGGATVFEGMSTIVNANAIGAADSEELTYQLGASLARELRCAGVNWRWAPVVDLGNRNSTASMRTFAIDDVERTIRLTKAYVRGMQDEGVAATLKHFPSEGRIEARDPHFTSPCCDDSLETWWSEQGRVYQELFDDGAYSVMIGHQSFPAVDDTMIGGRYIPSTISKKVITDLLKGQMGFQGVVITDGITMAGLYSLMPYEELIVELVNAGNDIILGSKLQSDVLIEQAVLDGRIAESRIDDACQRVLDMKEKLGMFRDDYGVLPYTLEQIAPETKGISAQIARRSMTLVRDRQQLLPIKAETVKKAAIIVSTHADWFMSSINNLKLALENRGIQVHLQRRLKNSAELKAISDENDLIIYAAYVGMHAPAGALRLFGDECHTFYHAFNHGKEKSIGVSFGYPYVHYDTMENAPTFINAYSASRESMDAFVQAIFGEIPCAGKSPVLLIPRVNAR